MKRSTVIHYLLAVALCFGQVVANTHLISHIGTPADAHAHNSTHNRLNEYKANHLGAHNHSTHEHTPHHKGSLSLDQTASDEANSDCAAYHAYAGLAAITPAEFHAVAIGPRLSLVINYHHSNVFTDLTDTQPIRGPPIHS